MAYSTFQLTFIEYCDIVLWLYSFVPVGSLLCRLGADKNLVYLHVSG